MPSSSDHAPIVPFTDQDRYALDPEIDAFRRLLGQHWARHPDLDGVSHVEARRIAEEVRAPFALGGPVMARTIDREVEAGGQRARLRFHVPEDAPAAAPALIYLHGGGWRLFSIDTHDRLMREYADRARIVVVGVDYALAPEAPHPKALRQVIDVFGWLQTHAAEFALDGARLALGGDSAGGNLALAAAIALGLSRHAPPPRALVLNYGTFSREATSDSHRLFDGPGFSLGSAEMQSFWRDYLGNRVDEAGGDPSAEPLRSPIADLRALPPAYLAIAQCDVLRDDSIAMAARMAEAGVDVTSVIYPGTVHSFLEAMSMAEVSRRALAETSTWLRRHLAAAGA